MRRRGIFVLGACAALDCPLATSAQQAKVPLLGVLALGNPDPSLFVAGLRDGLRAQGYSEGRNIRMELRSAGGRPDRLPEAAAELLRLKADLLVAWATPAALAARDATKITPIVMVSVGDPLATGLVTSLSKPGGNITGNSAIAAELMSKNVELIREVLPSVQRTAVLLNKTDPFSQPFLTHVETAARRLGIRIDPIWVSPSEDLNAHFENMRTLQADFVIVQPTLLRPHVIDLLKKYKLPSISVVHQFALEEGLISFSAFSPDQWREAAVYVDKILKGSLPGDLPVAQPTRFELVINLRTAKALGLTIPPLVLARADEVIE